MQLKKLIVGVLVALGVTACTTTNEITGRQQLLLFGADQDASLGLNAMNQVKQTAPVVTTGRQATRINRIGQRIAAVSDKPEFDWEFVLINEDTLNAWALPGGKVAVYAKMANALTDLELAAVLGHEVAHAVLRHGAESMSRQSVQQGIMAGVTIAASTQIENRQTAGLAVALANMAAQGFVALPHSRFMELEADDVGTIYMARAGYDPRAAVSLWQKMARLKEGGGAPPTFLSTHPSDGKRIARIQEKMPTYLAEYQKATQR